MKWPKWIEEEKPYMEFQGGLLVNSLTRSAMREEIVQGKEVSCTEAVIQLSVEISSNLGKRLNYKMQKLNFDSKIINVTS